MNRKNLSITDIKQLEHVKKYNHSFNLDEGNSQSQILDPPKKTLPVQSLVKNTAPNIQINLISGKYSPKLENLVSQLGTAMNQRQQTKHNAGSSTSKAYPSSLDTPEIFSQKNLPRLQTGSGPATTKHAQLAKQVLKFQQPVSGVSSGYKLKKSETPVLPDSSSQRIRFLSNSGLKEMIGFPK